MIKTIESNVMDILMQFPETRESDRILISKYVKMHCPEQYYIPFCDAIRSDILPSFETIRRTRQKLQRKYPELRASKKVQKYRAEKEQEYLKYARE